MSQVDDQDSIDQNSMKKRAFLSFLAGNFPQIIDRLLAVTQSNADL